MQTEVVKICPVCRGNTFRPVFNCEDHTYSHQQFTIQQCENCQLMITNPRPDQNTIGDYYKSDEYISHSGKTNSLFDWIYLRVRNYTLGWKQKIIQSRKPVGTILDYGCGTGEFIHHMVSNGWESFAIEPSDEARGKIKKHNNLTTFKSIDQLPEKKFDIITLWHVLEHVPNPDQLMQQLKQQLKEGGLIFVAVPNHEAFDAQHYKKHWAAYDVPRHFWHFAKNNMTHLLDNQQLLLKEVLPMKLDAFYVSLLSEKYKNQGHHNIFTPFRALINGLKSNSKGAESMNYSSLIYIAGHA